MMTRKQAIEALKDFKQCDFFADYIYDRLDDIIECLKAEDELGFDIWGVRDYLGSDFYKLLRGEKLDDEESLKSLYTKYHHSNRWSGKY